MCVPLNSWIGCLQNSKTCYLYTYVLLFAIKRPLVRKQNTKMAGKYRYNYSSLTVCWGLFQHLIFTSFTNYEICES